MQDNFKREHTKIIENEEDLIRAGILNQSSTM